MIRLFPFLTWLQNYNRKNLLSDSLAGITVAIMLIPQGMAYAMLAGLPPIIGLYASVAPLIIYALFGSSNHLAVGPVAMVSLLVAAGVSNLVDSNQEAYITYAILLALLIGIIQLMMGLARLGFLVNFISHPVISGFTSAAALIIGLSQLKHLLGMHIPRSHHIQDIVLNVIENAGSIHWPSLLVGGISIILLLLFKKMRPVFPGAIVVVIAGILAVTLFNLTANNVQIVGVIPGGMPSFKVPVFDFTMVEQLVPIALAISLVSYMESISVAKAMASKYRYKVDANQELVGLGLANIVGSLFQAYPVTGGFSRTAVNAQAGAKTPLASIITAGVIAITLLFFTPLLHDLPKGVLAAIIMVAVFGLVDIKTFLHLWHVQRADAVILLITFLTTLALGIEPGILIGVGLSLAIFLIRTTKPYYAILGNLPNSIQYRNIEYFPSAKTIDGAVILRVDASFYFGNVNFLEETISNLVAENSSIRSIIIDASSVNYIDSTAAEALGKIVSKLQEKGIKLLVANIKGPTREILRRCGLYDRIGSSSFFYSVHDAVAFHKNDQEITQILSEASVKPAFLKK